MARRKPSYPTDTNASNGSGYTGPQALERDGAFLWWPMQSESLPSSGLVTIVDPDDAAKNSTNQSANNTEIDDFVSGERMVRWGSANINTVALGADPNTTGLTVAGSFHRNAVVGSTDIRMFTLFEGVNRSAGVFFTGNAVHLVNAAGAYAGIAGGRSSRIDTVRVTFRRTPDGLGQVTDELFVNNRLMWNTGLFTPQVCTAACFIRILDGSANSAPCRDFHVWLEPRTDAQIKAQVDRYQPWLA